MLGCISTTLPTRKGISNPHKAPRGLSRALSEDWLEVVKGVYEEGLEPEGSWALPSP